MHHSDRNAHEELKASIRPRFIPEVAPKPFWTVRLVGLLMLLALSAAWLWSVR